MTYKVWIFAILAVLVFSSCAQTAPDLAGKNNITGTDPLSGSTVSINENNYGNENANGVDAKGNYNSSSDGFRSVYFDFDDYSISSQMEANMNTNIQVANSAGKKIKIEGHCDEFGTDEYNYALGLKRAKAVKDSLLAQGVSSRIILVSFGESSPVCQIASNSCYDRNRRVDLRLVR